MDHSQQVEAPVDHSEMDHSEMDHSEMDHSKMNHTPTLAHDNEEKGPVLPLLTVNDLKALESTVLPEKAPVHDVQSAG